ncbi:MAG TPA: tRNA (adenosine(37)-N6)-threonylcarbamoyltransferase complex ATPase subunit type 1 TsaE [Longimicrobium sp.]|nr:tRNA (adenosine(37)-N6)-threonylcarbamoyltransferase complex ATPase subunit type 1 TsaE [Longimicrobium sp.]
MTRAPDLQHTFESDSPGTTSTLGQALGRLLAPGHFVGLIGDLGAGKTHFARGVADGAGVAPSEVTSPTFAIVYPYQGRITLHHADLYRLEDRDELYATGFYDLIGGEGAVLVEWLDKIPEAAPQELLRLELEIVDDDRRRLHARAYGARHAELLRAWTAASRS